MSDQLTDEGLGRLRAVARRHVGDDRVPGLVALVACGDQVHAEALGTLSIGGAPVARDSLFRIASTTKPITAAATLALAGEGLLDLDAPIDAVLPELADRRVLTRMDGPLDDTVPARRAITTRDLLTFTFGFGISPGAAACRCWRSPGNGGCTTQGRRCSACCWHARPASRSAMCCEPAFSNRSA